jgi:DmsE family decaheme c-type cytochrome
MRFPRLLFPLAAGVLLLVAAASGGAAPAQQTPPSPQAPPAAAAATYVGADTCAACHSEVADHLAGTPHGKAAFTKLSSQGCESCHGPGSAHAENPDDPALRPRVEALSVAGQNAACRSCHDGSTHFNWDGSKHETRGLSCLSCHSIHAFKSEDAQLKARTEQEQCFACHKDIRADSWKNSHHPIREGKISCADCHNPHGTTTPKMIRAVSVNDQCYSCHAEKRGPFLWEHPPVRESCLNCHTPHGSNHLKLQKTSVPFICQQCHSNTRHPGTLYDGLRLPTLEDQARGSNRLFNRACLDCHAAIHGSNHPSSPYLGH